MKYKYKASSKEKPLVFFDEEQCDSIVEDLKKQTGYHFQKEKHQDNGFVIFSQIYDRKVKIIFLEEKR